MNKNIFVVGFVFVLLSSFVFADLTTNNEVYFSFDNNDLSGSDILDIGSGNSNTGTNVGATTGVSVVLGQGFSFTTNDYITNDNLINDISTNTVGTLCVWVNFDDLDSATIWSVSDTDADSRIELYLDATNDYLTAIQRIGGVWKWGLEVQTSLIASTDYYICLVQDGTQPSFFIDGVDQSANEFLFLNTDTTTWINSDAGLDNVRIGARYYNGLAPNRFLDGDLDELMYYSKVLSQTDIDDSYNSGSGYNPFKIDEVFTLTASRFFDNSLLNYFAVNITNETTTITISTNNGSVYYPLNKLVNISVYNATGFVKYNINNYNTSTNLNALLRRFELYNPINDTIINDSDNVIFKYNMQNRTAFNSCSLLLNDSIIDTNYTILNGINSFPYTFTDVGDYEWYIRCGVYNTSERRILSVNVAFPNIINFTPETNNTYAENQTVLFNVTYDSPITITINWFVDGILKAITQAFNWFIGQFDAEDDINVTVVVEDTLGQSTSNTWIVNVTETNFPPFVEAFTVSLTTIYENLPYDILCYVNDSDTNSANLTTDIQYNVGAGWIGTTETFVSDNLFKSTIPAFTHAQDDVISYRCRGTDNETPALISDWYVLTNYRTVGQEQTPPETPQILLPTSNKNKYAIPVICMGAYDDQYLTQEIFYEVYVRKNSTSWSLIRNMSEAVIYSYNIANDGYNTTYDLKCRAWDGVEYSDYVTNINASIKDNVPVFEILDVSDDKQFIAGTPYQQGYFIDVDALGKDYSIYKVTTECNEDSLLDYVFDHDYSKKVKGSYTCINHAGIYEHTINAIIFKNNTDEIWESVCRGLDASEQYCKLSKTYEVMIDE